MIGPYGEPNEAQTSRSRPSTALTPEEQKDVKHHDFCDRTWECQSLLAIIHGLDKRVGELEAKLFVERGRDYPAVDAFVKAADERDALVRALEDILIHFTPEHIDNVSGSDCGSRAKAALALARRSGEGNERPASAETSPGGRT